MLNKIFKHRVKITIAILIVLCFGIIRSFENKLFYDPFLEYFDSDFKDLPFPQMNIFKLFGGLFLRYSLNTGLSLALIFVLFRDLDMLKFSTLLYVFFGVLLFIIFFVIITWFTNSGWFLFYVRRFIIQPLFVILFIPAFYYQKQNIKK